MNHKQAAIFWFEGMGHLASLCAQSLHGGNIETARKYARWHDSANRRFIAAAAMTVYEEDESPAAVDWFGEDDD